MSTNDLLDQAIRALESELGVPVQLTVDTPLSAPPHNQEMSGRQLRGTLILRKLEVKKVNGLDSEYMADVSMIEGVYANFYELRQKLDFLNPIYSRSFNEKSASRRLYDLLVARGDAVPMLTNFVHAKISEAELPAVHPPTIEELSALLNEQVEVNVQNLNASFYQFMEGNEEKLFQLRSLLDSNGIAYLSHSFIPRLSGIYHSGYESERTKVANVEIAKFE